MKRVKEWITCNLSKRSLCAGLLSGLVSAIVMAFFVCMAAEAGSIRSGDEKSVRVGYYNDNEGFQTGCSDEERKSGYAYEYYQEIAKYTGWTYEYVYGSWEEIYEMLVNGELDLMAGVSKADDRMQGMLFPDYAMGEETYYIYVAYDSHISSSDVTTLNGARIGIKDNSYMRKLLENYMVEQGIDCKIIAYSGLAERIQALERGELDCILTVENDMVMDYRPTFKIGSADFYFVVNRNRPDLLAQLNDAQGHIMSAFPYYISRLQDKYFNRSAAQQSLTEKEAEWLRSHGELRVGYLRDYMPYCDSGEAAGELRGILPEILTEFEAYTGVPFTGLEFDNYNVMLQALEKGEIDIIFPTFGDLWYSEHQNYTQTIPVVSTRMSVVYRGDYQNHIYDRIAVSEGSPLQPFYLTINYPKSEQASYLNWEECLSAIQSGEVGSMLVNSNLIYRYLNEHEEFSDLHIAELEDTVNFCFAVRRSDSTLYSILNKGLNNIDGTRINDAMVRNSYVEPEYTIRSFLIQHIGLVCLIAGGFIVVLILFFFLYRSRVKRERKILEEAYDKEKKYIADKEEKFNIIGSLSRIYTYTYYINLEEHQYQVFTKLDLEENSERLLPVEKEKFEEMIRTNVKEQYRERLFEFLDFSTLAARMQATDSLSMEYETDVRGWCRGCFISARRDAQGRLLYVIYAIQEINEEKAAQERAQTALQEAYEAAKRANHAKSDFLARMSHDIRTPMNAIIGMTAIAAAHMDERERVEDCLRKITTSGKHLLTLINEVLDMSKIESGRLELTEEEFNLHELIDNMLTIMRPQVEEKKHTLKVSAKNLEHEAVIGDSLHLRQVIVNILGNSVKYTPPGGSLSLSVTEKAVNKSMIGCYEFLFEDNGIGMSQEFIEHIFEPFSRENETADNHVQGTGLGLSIVANLVRMMGGDIRVESEKGKGSRFIVTLYFRLQDDEEISFEEFVHLPILVVDDQQEACESTCLILHDLGMRSEWVQSGREAIERVRAVCDGEGYFAVMLDWKMPEMSGVETAKKIRKIAGDSLPIIILSGYDWPEIEEEAKLAGVNAFLSKPLGKSRLIYLFKRLINGESPEGMNSLEQVEISAFPGRRILLAEDNEINTEIAMEIFERAGLTVEHAWNGKEALELLTKAAPGYYDMIFMDIQMPIMNGYESARAIRAAGREDLKKIPIIAMTADAFAEDVRAAVQAGMNQHIAKPLDFGQLMEVLRKWLKKDV